MFKEYPKEVFNTTSAENILKELFELIQPKSVLDVGCGNGSWLKVFYKNYQIEDILGVDGFYVPKDSLLIPSEKFHEADLSKTLELSRVFDLVLSLEVAEHLAEASADIFVENLVKHGNTILFSAAIPGQGGLRHLNEQYPSYWLKKFKQHGYEFYDLIRPKVWHQQEIMFWYRQNTFIVANQQSPIAQNHQPTTWVDIVHPELFDREATRASTLEKGKAGIKTALASLRKSIATKFGF